MSKVMGPLILLAAVACGLFLLYRSSQQLVAVPPPAPSLVSGPVSPGRVSIPLPEVLRQPGTCFYVTAFDSTGRESAPSELICQPADYQAPAP